MTDEGTFRLKETTFTEFAKVRVTVIVGPNQGTTADVVDETIRVGSGAGNDLVLRDSSVSRLHCAIGPAPGGVRIRDEGSTNGVWIGSVRITDAIVAAQQELRLGSCRLRIEPLRETERRELALVDSFGDLLGVSGQMRQLFVRLAKWAPLDVPVLLLGETGCGKELAAAAIHRASPRATGPFVVLDCSNISQGLLESQLFGHEKGAFTGAVRSYRGAFERAQGGTLFLDELAELPLEQQSSLLRVLQESTIQKLGVEKPIKVEVRVIAATNRNLQHEMNEGRFRRDLYFRLEASTIRIPPLRDRLDDLSLLVRQFAQRIGLDAESIPDEVWEMFRRHSWPGNVRELRNAVQRFAVEGDPCLLPGADADGSEPPPPLSEVRALAEAQSNATQTLGAARFEVVEEFERRYLSRLLAQTQGSVSRAAVVAGVTEWGLRKLMNKHGVRPEAFRSLGAKSAHDASHRARSGATPTLVDRGNT
jgi:two-component system, NtrC family, nitrogen regulation response regulator GlnG